MQTAETVPHAACDCLRQEASVCRLPQSLAGNDRLALAEPVAGCRTIAKASRTPAPPFQSGSQRTKSQRISIPHDSLRLTCDSLQLPHSSALPKYCKFHANFDAFESLRLYQVAPHRPHRASPSYCTETTISTPHDKAVYTMHTRRAPYLGELRAPQHTTNSPRSTHAHTGCTHASEASTRSTPQAKTRTTHACSRSMHAQRTRIAHAAHAQHPCVQQARVATMLHPTTSRSGKKTRLPYARNFNARAAQPQTQLDQAKDDAMHIHNAAARRAARSTPQSRLQGTPQGNAARHAEQPAAQQVESHQIPTRHQLTTQITIRRKKKNSKPHAHPAGCITPQPPRPSSKPRSTHAPLTRLAHHQLTMSRVEYIRE